MDVDDRRTHETVDLLRQMIRNQCVNDGTVESGEEIRTADLLTTYLEGAGLDVETFEPEPGRASMVARIEGTDPDAPALCLMGHTDVVPVTPSGWHEDPFGGELIDGEVWGRGAVDMLCLTASMAVAYRHIARSAMKPRGDLIYFGVADEEAGGTWGARWIAEHHWDAIACDYVLTEFGGFPSETPSGTTITMSVAEKGLGWRRLHVKGTPGHGSAPYEADNALVRAAEVVRRLSDYRPVPQVHDLWRVQVDGLAVDDATKAALLDPETLDHALDALPDRARARSLHACCHTTFSPNVIHGGVKTNVIPDDVYLDVDIRTLPGETHADVEAHLRAALGELYDVLRVEPLSVSNSTASPIDTPMWDTLERIVGTAHPGARMQPGLIVGGTDSRFFRERGAVAYGAGLFSPKVTLETFSKRFHGHDERVDVESLGLSTQLWIDVVDSFWDHVA
jgi:acetylornithine deacetylase/succinyl-diaminopimelate desuccinylase-like protein